MTADDSTDVDTAETAATMARLRRLSYYLDESIRIPGTTYRIGVDPLLGLVPVVGDAPGAALSAYVVAEAAALGVSRATLARMLGTLVLDAVVGSLPVVGDAFDAVWKANLRNVRLLEARQNDPAGADRDRRVLTLAAVGLAVGLLVLGAASVVVAWWAVHRTGLW